jgi:hypothetical protein
MLDASFAPGEPALFSTQPPLMACWLLGGLFMCQAKMLLIQILRK